MKEIVYYTENIEDIDYIKNITEYTDNDIEVIIKEGDKTDGLIQYIKDNPNIKAIHSNEIITITNTYHEMIKLVDYCFARKINIVCHKQRISLFNSKGDISVKFKSQILIDTDFESF